MHGADKSCRPRFRIHFQLPHHANHEVEELVNGVAVGLEHSIAYPIDPDTFVRGEGVQGLHDLFHVFTFSRLEYWVTNKLVVIF